MDKSRPARTSPAQALQPDAAKTALGCALPSAGTSSLRAEDLFARHQEVTIVHGQDCYRLRLTRQNKLILTK